MLRFIVPAIVCVVGALARRPLGTELTTDDRYEQDGEDPHKRGAAEGRARFEARLASIIEHGADPCAATCAAWAASPTSPRRRGAQPRGRAAAAAADARTAATCARSRELLPPASAFPPELDWRARGAVTPVKHRASAGAAGRSGRPRRSSRTACVGRAGRRSRRSSSSRARRTTTTAAGTAAARARCPSSRSATSRARPGETRIPYVSGFGTSNGTTMVSYDATRGRG